MKFKLISLFICFIASTSAFAGDKRLEEEVAEVRRILEAQTKNLATSMSQVQQMVSDFQKLSGQVEQGSYGNEQQSKITSDNQRRLQILEERTQHLITQLEEIKATGLLPAAQLKDLTQFRNYEAALSKVNALDYRGAISSFETFITANAKSRYCDSAQYWIGESYYSLRDFPKAISEFQKVIRDYPKSNKASLSLLKQGNSFFEMQSFDDAKAFYTKLITKFPGTQETTQAQARINEINELLEKRALEAAQQKR